jgi:acetyl-CoA acyltransferase
LPTTNQRHTRDRPPAGLRKSTGWATDLEKTNVNGGAIAIGHPLGASGARIMTALVNALEQRGGRYGLQTMCEGGGMANATIIDRLG